jgi:hypothetical protein
MNMRTWQGQMVGGEELLSAAMRVRHKDYEHTAVTCYRAFASMVHTFSISKRKMQQNSSLALTLPSLSYLKGSSLKLKHRDVGHYPHGKGGEGAWRPALHTTSALTNRLADLCFSCANSLALQICR